MNSNNYQHNDNFKKAGTRVFLTSMILKNSTSCSIGSAVSSLSMWSRTEPGKKYLHTIINDVMMMYLLQKDIPPVVQQQLIEEFIQNQ